MDALKSDKCHENDKEDQPATKILMAKQITKIYYDKEIIMDKPVGLTKVLTALLSIPVIGAIVSLALLVANGIIAT
ncbi:MAG: hypothetical protein L3J28_14795 [Candidatus Polarisedimenticolaceae bacterium]|nr:hypothetical protein [Candidatus Polarisedimenticolaceae bacterium]